MLIVSQNKEVISNIDNMECMHIKFDKEGFMLVHENTRTTNILGIYNTKEKAKEVLQEIIKAKAFFEKMKMTDDLKFKREQLIISNYKYFDIYEIPTE